MSDFFSQTEPAPPSDNAHAFTVSELSHQLKRTVEDQFGFVRVRGELSGVKLAASGHLYLGLKDDQAVMDGVCWRGNAQKLSFRPEDGLEVVCTGKLTTYPSRSKYQLVIDHMEPAGAGALMALLEERKKKLALEGLFDADRKQPLPYLPEVIGIVTSPTGSVIRDILHRLSDRFPRRVLVWPVLVQGEKAASQVSEAIKGFNALPDTGGPLPRPDLIIVARGGGSIEDLWPFNEENVVRAASESRIPLISAVGHETDTTLIDYVSDMRAPTPTGAAEMAVPVRAELMATVADMERRLYARSHRLVAEKAERLSALARAMPRPDEILALRTQKLDDVSERLPRALKARVAVGEVALVRTSAGLSAGWVSERIRQYAQSVSGLAGRLRPSVQASFERSKRALEAHGRILESLSYERVLERGYALVTRAGAPLTHASGAHVGDTLTLYMRGGQLEAGVTAQSLGPQDGSSGTGPTAPPNLKARSEPATTDTGPELATQRQKNEAPSIKSAPKKPAPKKSAPKTDPSQGSLF